MVFDIIDFYINCLNTTHSVCLGQIPHKRCKYLWLCKEHALTNYTTMIYSEGE